MALLLLIENLSYLFSFFVNVILYIAEREVKNVKYFLVKELSELIFCLTFVKDALYSVLETDDRNEKGI